MPVLVGLMMALAAVTTALVIASVIPPAWFPELVYNCAQNGMDPFFCAMGSIKAGIYSVGALAIVFAISAYLARYTAQRNGQLGVRLDSSVTKFVLAAVMAILIFHLVAQHYGPAETSRLDEIIHYSPLISIENLLWPLLLQMFVMNVEERVRIRILGVLIVILAVTPYRSVFVAVLIFGFIVPIAMEVWVGFKSRWPRQLVYRILTQSALASVITVCAAWGSYVDSVGRDLTEAKLSFFGFRTSRIDRPCRTDKCPVASRQIRN
jgi:hypothetical protein